MGTLLELVGFALIALWAGVVYGWPWAVMVVGIALLLVGFAFGDVTVADVAIRLHLRADPEEHV